MSSLSQYSRATRPRYVPRIERLESRQLFAVSAGTGLSELGPISPAALTIPLDFRLFSNPGDLSTLNVVQTSPADGSSLFAPPDQLEVTFNQPFPSYNLGRDIGLQRIDDDGNVLEDLTDWLQEPWDMELANITVLPVAINTQLTPGRYQVVLLGTSSFLSGVEVEGNPGAPLINSGVDEVISRFTIVDPNSVPAPTLATANDLGTVGSVPIAASGLLDLSTNLGNYNLYKFTLAPGHYWRLGAEVTAQRDQGSLNTALALFDDQGRLVKFADTGRADAPFDPYLFSGLRAGTYYLGVSSTLNAPGQPGGYDPVAGRYGTGGLDQDSGTYRLHIIADPADRATYLLDSRLTYADPLDSRPTGLTVVFSGPMDIESFQSATGSGVASEFHGLEVVDDSGRVWPLSIVSYQESNSQFTFLFNQPLPNGHYTLRVPAQGAVKDLAGWVPSGNGGPQGTNPIGVLTTWTVNTTPPVRGALDLGAILGYANEAVYRSGSLAPSESVIYRFVVPADGILTLQSVYSSDSFLIQLLGPDGFTTLRSGAGSGLGSNELNLPPGVYSLRFAATGSQPVDFRFALFGKPVSAEAILENGVGQGPALNLALITPTALEPLVAITTGSGVFLGPVPFSAGATPEPVAPPSTTLGGGTVTTSFVTVSTGSGLVLTLGNSLVGSPTAGAETVSAVGPGNQAGVTALAANTTGLLQGITYGYGQSLEQFTTNPVGETTDDSSTIVVSTVDVTAPADGALIEPAEPVAVVPQTERASGLPSEWLSGFATTLLNWFAPAPEVPINAVAPAPVDRIVLTRDDQVTSDPDEQVEHADLAAPLSLSVVSMLALRLQKPLRSWIGQRKQRGTERRKSGTRRVPGPHTRV